ncbi:MAG: cobalt-precorrin-5B (C(1))-methyltransferase CbiD [Prevotella sp.]|nr:cobalt-precorrin-5B (C(1))-methyltransferase CbiD [Prevotella sp.]
MILVFGGTTEGRKAVKELEESGNPFYYSTKMGEQDIVLHHGVRIDGALDKEAMHRFCRDKGIRLIVDAAHPFAERLHLTIEQVSFELQLPVVRFERMYLLRKDVDAVWCKDYAEAMEKICAERAEKPLRPFLLLATTGVQSIKRLSALKQSNISISHRILPRESSLQLAYAQGATQDELCYYEGGENENRMLDELQPNAVLMKESGLTGGFREKVEAARKRNIPVFVIERPPMPPSFHVVNGEHGLRRMVEHLLPDFYPLKSGLTTGTCATAAALAAAGMLLEGKTSEDVLVVLPNGETIMVKVVCGKGYASVYKESGDDPDVTNGLEIRAEVSVMPDGKPGTIDIQGGEGVGIVTLPGFDSKPGEAAINRVPRQMITDNLLRRYHPRQALRVVVSVPKGREIASKTFNPRLGIVDGISIVGVSGIIKPFSEEGFLNSIRKCMEVAKASGCNRVVINSGAKSERYVKQHCPDLPPQVFVEYGNYIGETIKMAAELEIAHVTLGVMLGKAVKLAAGHLDTHSKRSLMEKGFIQSLLRESGCTEEIIERAKTITLARELWDILPSELVEPFCQTVMAYCLKHCAPLLPNGCLTIFLMEESGEIHTSCP